MVGNIRKEPGAKRDCVYTHPSVGPSIPLDFVFTHILPFNGMRRGPFLVSRLILHSMLFVTQFGCLFDAEVTKYSDGGGSYDLNRRIP